MEAAAKRGNADALRRLVEPPVRASHRHVWDWWLSLNSRRAPGLHGPGVATWADAHAWALEMRIAPTPREWDLLAAIDLALEATDTPSSAADGQAPAVPKKAWPEAGSG